MKHVKMLGLLVMAAASLMAFASSASAAPVLTSASAPGSDYTGTIHATLEVNEKGESTSALLKAGITTTCTESTVDGTVSVNNTSHAEGAISSLTFNKCGTSDVKTITPGSLTINDAGEVFAINNNVEIKETSLGVTCFYGGAASPGTKLGTLSGTKLAVSTTKLQRKTGSNFFCAAEGTWTANYVVTTPAAGFLIT